MDVLQIPLSSLLMIVVATVVGFFAHVLLKVGELREQDPAITLTKYFSQNPYRSVSKLIVVIGSTLVLAEPTITPMVLTGAFGIGYIADSAPNKFGSRS